MRWLRWTGIALLMVIVLIAATITWMLNSHTGTSAALRMAQRVMGDTLRIGQVEGVLAGPLSIHDLEFGDPTQGTHVSARLISVNVKLMQLLRKTVYVSDAQLRGIVVNSRPTAEPEPPSSEPFTLKPPVNIVIDRLRASDVGILNSDEPVFQIDRATFQGRWTDAGVAVKQLDVRSPQGEVHFVANVRQDRIYLGEGKGSFRWEVGDLAYRGTVNAGAQDENARIAVHLTSPMRAQLNVTLKQSETLPWRFDLNVPAFDPRADLMPDSSMQTLGARLAGEGSLASGRVTGQVLIDGDTLHLQPLKFARKDTQLDFHGEFRINDQPNALRAEARIHTNQQPTTANVKLDWDELIVPEKWAGQVLHTRGNARFDGNAQQFETQGELTIGPERQRANIAFHANGTQEAVQLQQFDIVQPRGRLAATGSVDLKPHVGWDVKARANRFDPGAFAVNWKGELDFALASTGQITEAGPDIKFLLQDLRGRLRARRLAGNADLHLTPDKVLAGVLNLSSGESRVRVEGRGGQAMDALVTLNVASLDDWIPDTNGRIDARYTVTGKWPELNISGNASASELRFVDTRAASVNVDLDVTNPSNPSGDAHVRISDVSSAGFHFQRWDTEISGNRESHRLAMTAVGEPFDTDVVLQGSLKEDTWTAELQTLMLDVERVAHLTLKAPATLSYSPSASSVSDLCLQDGEIQLCAAGELHPDGSLQARYSLSAVPLALANVLAPELPLALEGTLQGAGDIQRDAQGALFGRAEISSPNGQIAQRMDDAGKEKQTLLRYEDLNLAATLSGPEAQGRLQARLDDRGQLNGEVVLQGLDQAVTPLRGEVSLALPSIAPVALFVPQLANLSGSVDSRIGLGGSLQAPQISGYVRANDLGMDVPALGLRLREGRVEVSPQEDGSFRLAGRIRSGDGQVEFDGNATQQGMATIDVRGEDFLAADIPSANVIVNPKLAFVRDESGMKLNGEVEVPKAKINLQKLPGGGKKVQRASSDVIVIDERTTKKEVASTPLVANITVILGDRVQLTGYGLQARVQGRLGVREVPGEPTTGSGEIRIRGQYKAYGQDLTIEQGQVLYAGTPIDNPRLNIVAVRKIEEENISAGLRITGTAQAPQLSVFSDPEMGESNALAYLVTGKPIDQVGSNGDTDMLQSAAQSLGTAAGGLMARSIGKRLGVDEVSVKESEALGGGAAFTVGQYLSPRLFLSYGVGLFEPGEVITLRYRLSKGLALLAERGPIDTRAGLRYRIER
jgi:translocation and assembly module TamB